MPKQDVPAGLRFSLALPFQFSLHFHSVHRIGQTRTVRVYQYAMKDSLEERMYRVQENKTALGNGSLRKLTAAEEKKARITALRGTYMACCRCCDLIDIPR